MTDSIVQQELVKKQIADEVNDPSQPDVTLENSIISTGAGVSVAENVESSTSKRKRRRRKRKRPNTVDLQEAVETKDCNTFEEELLGGGFHSSFHGVVYDEEGNPKEIILRQNKLPHINRKRQKRMGSCTFKWDSTALKCATVIPVKRGKYDSTSSATTKDKPKVKNLEVRIHRYENNYETVVNYWYTTLDWLDRAAIENDTKPTEENETEDHGGDHLVVGEYDYNADDEVTTRVGEQKTIEKLDECSHENKVSGGKEGREDSAKTRGDSTEIEKEVPEESECSASAEHRGNSGLDAGNKMVEDIRKEAQDANTQSEEPGDGFEDNA